MKRFGWILLLMAVTPNLLSAQNKMTVGQLEDLLASLHHSKKSDEQVANQLKGIVLIEELTPAAISKMVPLINGPLSTEQMYVLEARSAMLAPPDTDLPKASAPDAAAQRALLAKAQDYAAKTYPQLPRFTATRLVVRFQDGAATIQSYGGTQVKVQNDSDPVMQQNQRYVRLIKADTEKVEIDNGIEKPAREDTTPWGRNGLVSSMLPVLPLDVLTSEAVSTGNPKFLRWETVNGQKTAVFAFVVEKKKSHYAINYCCFPETSSFGGGLYGGHGGAGGGSPEPAAGAGLGGLSASAGAHPLGNGNLGYVADWNPFKSKSAYRGELFLDPETGVVLRTIVEAKFKSYDFVHYENIRVDYAPMRVGRDTLYLPVSSFTNAEVVPNGDSQVSQFGIRHQYVIQDYKGFHSTDGTYQVVALVAQGGKTAEPGASPVLSRVASSTLSGMPSSTLSGVDDDEPPAGGFAPLESLSRPAGPLAISATDKPIQRPPDDDIRALIAKAAQNANVYWDSLPNFTCRKVTQRFVGSNGKDKWENIDTLTGRINYFDHQEDLVPESKKDHAKSSNSSSDLSDFGIFGDVIRGIFRPAAKADISWFENDALDNGTIQVFKYSVAKENSNLYLRGGDNEVVRVGYHGMVYIDSASGDVRRITQIADDVPKHYPIYGTLISTDYDYVSIGGQKYLLPIGAQVVLRHSHKGRLELNQIAFSDFHRYRSTSRIVSNTAPLQP